MATAAEILATVNANTSVLNSIAVAADALNEGQVSIADQIAELKRQIEAGQTPDLSELEAAVDNQTAVISGLKDAVGANTPAEPPA